MRVVSIPLTKKPIHIKERQEFPRLDVIRRQSVLDAGTCKDLINGGLDQLIYTSIVKEGDCGLEEKMGEFLCWLSFRGDWLYMTSKDQKNALPAYAWPQCLKDLALKLIRLVPELEGRLDATACLIAYLRPGNSVTYLSKDADSWNDIRSPIVDVVIGEDEEGCMVELSARFKNAPSMEMQLPNGSVFLSNKRELDDWDMNVRVPGTQQRGVYYLSFRHVHPMLALRQQNVKPNVRLVAALEMQKIIVPAFEGSVNAAFKKQAEEALLLVDKKVKARQEKEAAVVAKKPAKKKAKGGK